ncbi:MAG: 50S ribosomal protein L29 [Candidatus Omnitrophota bacterium]|nr:50S ribosomal protein L29 [Candidatus Omnitrophota bacterium]
MAAKLPRAQELRALPEPELRAQLEALRQQMWRDQVKVKEGSVQQTHMVRLSRRQIARLQTVLREQRPKRS